MERGGRLRDLLAIAAGKFLADGLDHFPLSRHHLQRFGDILAHPHDPVGSAARAGRGGLDHEPLARQVLWKRLADGLAPVEATNLCRLLCGLLGADGIFGRGGFQLLELQLELVDQPGGAFGAVPILGALEHRDLELQARDHRLGCRHDGILPRQFSLCGRQFGA